MSRDPELLRRNKKNALEMARRYVKGERLKIICADYGINPSTCRARIGRVLRAGESVYVVRHRLIFNHGTGKYEPDVPELNNHLGTKLAWEREYPKFWLARVEDAAMVWGLREDSKPKLD